MKALDDGSIVDNTDKIIFVSFDRFRDKVCEGEACLICAKTKTDLTKEHIVPDWILRRFDLHDKAMHLPNGSTIKYRRYVVPCCEDCNKLLGNKVEELVSAAFEAGIEGVRSLLERGGGPILFSWLCLLFFKIHFKDKSLLLNQDRRVGTGSIADEHDYDWGEIHHLYCLARMPFTDVRVAPEALGSLGVFSMKSGNLDREGFDLLDLTFAKTLGIRIGEVGLIGVFGDGGAVLYKLNQIFLQRLRGQLTFPQFRELVAHFGCCRLHLKNPPEFATFSDDGSSRPLIACPGRDPSPEFFETDASLLGRILEYSLYETMKDAVDLPNFRERLIKADISFLFHEDGSFLNQPVG